MDTSRGRPSRPLVAMMSLSSRSSSSRPTNGGSGMSLRPCPPPPATTRRARQVGTGAALPLSDLIARRLERDRASAARIVASPTRTVPGVATDWMRAVVLTRSPATMPSLVGPDGHRGLAAHDPGASLDASGRGPDGVEQLQRRPDGPLRVVFAGRRRAPDRHHGVADELLDDAAVQLDDLGRDREVAGERLAHLFRVAFLREGCEANEVGEQHADETPFGSAAGGALVRYGPSAHRSR